jgi:hypothetical protein
MNDKPSTRKAFHPRGCLCGNKSYFILNKNIFLSDVIFDI